MLDTLSEYIYYAPPEVQLAFCNGVDREQENWMLQPTDEAVFYGILFRDKKVYMINIYTFSSVNYFQPRYLDITSIFKALLKDYNIYHLCILLKKVLRPYYTDSTLTENISQFLKYDHANLLHKRRYAITKQHNRYKKFIDTPEHPSHRVWTKIIYKALGKVANLQAFRNLRDERPCSLYFGYTTQPKLCVRKHSNQSSTSLRKKGKRKARRRAGAFTPQKRGTLR